MKLATKIMMLIFFGHKEVIYQYEVPQDTIVNADHYMKALKTLKIHIARKRNHLVESESCITIVRVHARISHDNQRNYNETSSI